MKKNFSILFLISVIVISIFFISTGRKTKAEECNDCPTPTEPGDADYCLVIPPLKLDPTNPDEITAGSSIVIKVLDGSAPFIWEDPGDGYSWASGEVDPENPDNKITNGRTNTLQCTSGTCGIQYDEYATITVTDNCGETSVAVIRADGGAATGWVRIRGGSSGSIILASNDFYVDNIKIHLEIRHTISYLVGSSVCTSPVLKYPLIDNQDATFYSEVNGVPHYMEKYGVRSASEYHTILAGWWDELIAAAGVNYGVCYRRDPIRRCGILDIQNPCVPDNSNYGIGYNHSMSIWQCN